MKKLSCLFTISVLLSFFCFGELMTKSFAQDCDAGGPIALTFEYTGGGCTASNNGQGLSDCSDTNWTSDPASVTVSTTDDGYSITPNTLNLNEKFVVRRSGDPLYSNSYFTLTSGSATEELTIHTSCSQPLVYGEDIFGSLTLVGYIGVDCINNLSAAYASGGVQLTWDETGADHYNVYRSDTPGGPYTFRGSTSDATFLDATTGSSYYYILRPAIFNDEEICDSDEVAAPYLVIAKDTTGYIDNDGNGVLSPGDTLQYSLTCSNIGNASATNVTLTDDPDETYVATISSISDGGTYNGDIITWNPANLASGDSLTITYNASLEGAGTFQAETTQVENTAILDSNETLPVADDEAVTVIILDSDGDGLPDDVDPDTIADVVGDTDEVPDSAFADMGGGHRTAMLALLNAIEIKIADGKINKAIKALEKLRERVDGCDGSASESPDNNDWVTDCDAQRLIQGLIDGILARLESL
jgi:uncharacterized repeat protein (TIGR01451 family)